MGRAPKFSAVPGSATAEEVVDVERDEFAGASPVREPAGRERRVRVVREENVPFDRHLHLLDRHEREGEAAADRTRLGDPFGIGDIEQIHLGELLDESSAVHLRPIDQVYTLELGDLREASRLPLRLAEEPRVAFGVVTLDDQSARSVDHVEVADVVASDLKCVLPALSGPLLGLDVEFEDPEHLFAVHRLDRRRMLEMDAPSRA